MARVFVVVGVIYLATVATAGVLDSRNNPGNAEDKGKEPEKKPNIVKDYVCLRDGELCHPDFSRNRGLYVSCSNGVAWEQQCPRCSYHPLNCPTRSLWFDGEKCDWASPKLASQPCIDRFPAYENLLNNHGDLMNSEGGNANVNGNPGKDQSSGQASQEQENLFQSLQITPMGGNYYKSPKAVDDEIEMEMSIHTQAVEDSKKAVPDVVEEEDERKDVTNENEQMRTSEEEEAENEFPTYLSPEDSLIGSKIVRLSDPVYTLVNNPDGSGKKVLMRVSQPFVLDDPARSLGVLPNLNVISSFSDKE